MTFLEHFSALMNVPETCQELGSRGVNRSGPYPISPVGRDVNELPIDVFCEFPGGETSLGKIEEISVEAGRKINFLLVQCRKDG